MSEKEKHIPGLGHRMRMRKRFAETYSLQNFSEEEALEMALYYALPKQDTTDCAKALLSRFQKLSQVLDAPYEELIAIPGIGEYTAIYFKFLKALIHKYQGSKNTEAPEVGDISRMGAYCAALIGNEPDEVLSVIVADSARHITGHLVLPAGNTSSMHVDIRKLMAFILKEDACFVVLSHNHPNGSLIPSHEDIDFTKNLQEMLLPYGIGLLDHFIVFNDKYFSLCQRNMF